jgi:hypothetical protein
MLKAAYPAIKAADPGAQVIFGGLLLDCDPTLPDQERPCSRGSFLEGALKAGGGQYFDLLAYHSYVYWGPVAVDWDVGFPSWKHRGGAQRGKLAFLRSVMERYGLQKPIIVNEGGLLCFRADPSCGPQGYYEAQANYAVRFYTRAWADGLSGAVWFTLNGPGWQDGGLLTPEGEGRPAFRAVRFLAQTLGGATLVESSSDGVLELYRFRKGDRIYTVAWTNDGSARELSLPAGTLRMYTAVGDERPAGATLQIDFEPVIIEAAAGT